MRIQDILGRITNRIDNGVQMNSFAYNPRSEVLYSLFGTNETDYAYDDIGNHSLYPANNLNQYVDNAIAYDADGNMTRCGTWTFGWDAENRLASANDGTTSITNAYDYKHRRVRKTVGSKSHAFVYDGWNLLAETINDTERTHYFWGLDLSDSLQGAGGVGGLLAVSQSGTMYYPVYDNNGNVTAYLDDSGNIVTAYEYNAFGETISQSGSMADEFAFRFSTKYHDNETGLYYYGYRFYDPTLRTWLSRDPIEEDGGLNLYGFCGNNGVNRSDSSGLVSGGFLNFGEERFVSSSLYGRVEIFIHDNSFKCKKRLFSSCYELFFSLTMRYNLLIASDTSSVWERSPRSYPADPAPPNWNKLSLAEKKQNVLLHENKHLNAFRVWYTYRVKVLEQYEAKGYANESDCISVGERLVGETRDSWIRVYNAEVRHANW